MSEDNHPFYGEPILRDRQQQYIDTLLLPYRGRKADDALKKEIWDLLQQEKYAGRISIPFKIALRRDPDGKNPDYIEVILDTKV